MDNWITPAIGMFLIGQVGATVWWASGTDTKVENNTTAIEKVVQNEKEIAVIEVQQKQIQADVGSIEEQTVEMKKMIHDILIMLKSSDFTTASE